jgi:hypothetical protein
MAGPLRGRGGRRATLGGRRAHVREAVGPTLGRRATTRAPDGAGWLGLCAHGLFCCSIRSLQRLVTRSRDDRDGAFGARPHPRSRLKPRRTAHRGFLICKARWQSGHAAACKAVYAGSIPTLASSSHRDQPAFCSSESVERAAASECSQPQVAAQPGSTSCESSILASLLRGCCVC